MTQRTNKIQGNAGSQQNRQPWRPRGGTEKCSAKKKIFIKQRRKSLRKRIGLEPRTFQNFDGTGGEKEKARKKGGITKDKHD